MSCESFASVEFDLYPCFNVQLGHHIEKAFYPPYCCSLGFEPVFVVRLPAFLINTGGR